MLPVPFAGNLRYDGIFILSYVAWILFEVVMGKSRKAKGTAKGKDRGSFFFLVGMIWVGIFLDFTFCFGVQRAAIPWGEPLFLCGNRADVDRNRVPLLLHASSWEIFHV